ncbi:DUF6455 family protein [Sedimentitalea sp. JM2-8]|uniref:DUF6455 family protein n=1 Tax=Sedimentitalea xiamensis TaxID=3050037 RepID=A0ABT7FB26_9RHOB|nr:DUF6455 family protein [Sedimentitalea xiamensis]MDK3072313.1 DUF6455 family protein [Sedimentitalea xiamensis]
MPDPEDMPERQPRRLGRMMRHVRLVSRMAKATQTDLVEASEAGTLTQPDWADMVQTCRCCTGADRCPEWLDDHPCADGAPAYCLNRGRFKRLRAQSEEQAAGGV